MAKEGDTHFATLPVRNDIKAPTPPPFLFFFFFQSSQIPLSVTQQLEASVSQVSVPMAVYFLSAFECFYESIRTHFWVGTTQWRTGKQSQLVLVLSSKMVWMMKKRECIYLCLPLQPVGGILDLRHIVNSEILNTDEEKISPVKTLRCRPWQPVILNSAEQLRQVQLQQRVCEEPSEGTFATSRLSLIYRA